MQRKSNSVILERSPSWIKELCDGGKSIKRKSSAYQNLTTFREKQSMKMSGGLEAAQIRFLQYRTPGTWRCKIIAVACGRLA